MKKFSLHLLCLFLTLTALPLSAAKKPVALYGHSAEANAIGKNVLKVAGVKFERPSAWSKDAFSKYSVICFVAQRPAGADYASNSAEMKKFVENGGVLIFTGASLYNFCGTKRNLSKAAPLLGLSTLIKFSASASTGLSFTQDPLAKKMQLNGKNFDWQRGANAAYAKLAGAKSIAVFNGTKSFQAITVHRIGKGAVYLIGPSLFRYSALHKRLGDADAEGRFILNEAGISVQALQKLYRTIILSSPNVAQTAPVKSSWGIKPLGKAGKLTYTDVKFHNQPEFKAPAALPEAFKISENGKALAQIAYASRHDRSAARELKYHLDAITGGKFAIVELKRAGKMPLIVLDGAGNVSKNMMVIATGKDRITLQGNIELGLFYLLEKLGCRFLWPGKLGKVIPRKATLSVPQINIRHTPMLSGRKIRHGSMTGTGDRTLLAMKRLGIKDIPGYVKAWRTAYFEAKGNSSFYAWHGGGGTSGYSWGHSFGGFYKQYGKSNPEFFALQPDGSRSQAASPERCRLCLSNKKLAEVVGKRSLAIFKKRPAHIAASICLNDGGRARFCMCEECRKLDPVNGSPLKMSFPVNGISQTVNYVALTDRVFTFSNRVAEIVAREMPDKKVSVYVYSSYSAPPTAVKPHPNLVLVSTAMSYTNDNHRNRARHTLAALSSFGNDLVWRPNALRGFEGVIAPQNYARKMFDDTELLKANGLKAVDFDCNQQFWACKGLVYYMLAKAIWNPDRLSYDDIFDDYCRSGFGAAAGDIKAYWNQLEKLFDEAAAKGVDYNDVFNLAAIAKLEKILASAAAKVSGNELARVRFLQAGLNLGKVHTRVYDAQKAQNTKLYKQRRQEYLQLLRKLAFEDPLVVNMHGVGFKGRFAHR